MKSSEKNVGNTNHFGKSGKQLAEWYGHVARMDYKIWRKRIMTWSLEGRRRRGRPDVKWEKKVGSVMKKKDLTSDDAVNRQLWRLIAGNRWTTGKHT
jgi:hypothetical protein